MQTATVKRQQIRLHTSDLWKLCNLWKKRLLFTEGSVHEWNNSQENRTEWEFYLISKG